MSSDNPYDPMKAAFEAAGIGVPDPTAEIGFKEGCIRMGFHHRQNFKIALKRQRAKAALGKTIADDRLPQPHWKDGRQWFWLREVEAYIASKHGE